LDDGEAAQKLTAKVNQTRARIKPLARTTLARLLALAPSSGRPPQGAAAGKVNNPISLGPAPKGDPFRQFSDFLHWPSPENAFDVVSLALENDLATPRIFAAISVAQHQIHTVRARLATYLSQMPFCSISRFGGASLGDDIGSDDRLKAPGEMTPL
jgi:hypothetical protein